NDFILIFVEDVTPELARFMCDRHFGIGADGVIRILPASNPDYDFHFRLFNSDGGPAEVSGNGLRCVGRFLHEAGLWSQPRIKVETGGQEPADTAQDRKSTRLNSSHVKISYAVFCLKKKI